LDYLRLDCRDLEGLACNVAISLNEKFASVVIPTLNLKEEWLPLQSDNLPGSSELKQELVVSLDDDLKSQMVVEN